MAGCQAPVWSEGSALAFASQTWLTGDPWANPEQRHLAHSMQELQMSIFKKCSYPKKKKASFPLSLELHLAVLRGSS